ASSGGYDDNDRGTTPGAGGPVRAHVGRRRNRAVSARDWLVRTDQAGAGARWGRRGVQRAMTRESREEKTMHTAPAVRVIAAAGALSVLLVLLASMSAWAGQFTVASCQADRVNFSTTAFNDFASRGMAIRRACNPEGPGIR